MQRRWFLVLTYFALCVQTSTGDLHAPVRFRRQATTSDLPSLTTTPIDPSDSVSSVQSLAAATSPASSAGASSSAAASSSSDVSSGSSSDSSRKPSSTSTHVSKTSAAASSTSAASSATSTAEPNNNENLPVRPHITPALSVAGVLLILSGTTYTLIGIKNKWIQIFLSTLYLVSISVLVLIVYVMHPPVSDAIQGAYFVAIFMTGCIFGGGALIFKEVTEGLGCLLGGFCLGMWFLTLKAGGVVSGSTGVGILLAVFCIVGWGLSFSKYTRDYALIGSTSFAGATAFTLGIDCFSRVGYKEFWLYIWKLNSDLFPLNTDTYPLTRGMRVEIAVIVIVTIVGVISQVKLWKVIRERRKEKETVRLEEESRRDAVDEALGRHLQRQNEMAKQQWEKIYGDGSQRPISMVDSVIDPEDQSKRGSRVSILRTRMHSALGSHSQIVELRPINPRQSSANLKRQSTMSANAIPEENEDYEQLTRNNSTAEVSARSLVNDVEAQAGVHKNPEHPTLGFERSLIDGPTLPNTTTDTSSVGSTEPEPTKNNPRKSIQSFLKRLSGHHSGPEFGPPSPALPSASQEALTMQQEAHHSRASSLAATIDEDHDKPDANRLSAVYSETTVPPAIVVTPGVQQTVVKRRSFLDITPSLTDLSVEDDPEELTRPVPHGTNLEVRKSQASLRSASQPQSATSERRGSSGEQAPIEESKTSLTTGALEAVPSQLSNVVLSYRTNEWAKHITTADAPDEEPLDVGGDDKDELPTQVLTAVSGAKMETQGPVENTTEKSGSIDSTPTIDKSLSATSKPPKPHVLPQREDIVGFTMSGNSVESGGLQKDDLKLNQSTGDLSRMMSKARPTVSTGRGLSSSSTPMLSQSLVTSPIEENVQMSFPQSGRVSTTPLPADVAVLSAQHQNLLRNESMQRSLSRQELPLRQSMIRSSSRQDVPIQESMMRSPSRTSVNSDVLGNMSGRVTPVPNLGPIARPSTRLSSYDSRQPVRQTTAPTSQQRESMLAQWRTSMRQDIGVAEHPEQTMAHRRAEMIAQKAMLKRSESQQSYVQATREGAMDQLMRRGDMQDAHRAALRKMQAKANETAK